MRSRRVGAGALRYRARWVLAVTGAIGLPLSAFDEATLAFDPLQDFSSPGDLTSADVRRTALQSRSDILGALADYAAAQATPMTYQLPNGKQYVIIAAGGHGSLPVKLGDYLIAYALPDSLQK